MLNTSGNALDTIEDLHSLTNLRHLSAFDNDLTSMKVYASPPSIDTFILDLLSSSCGSVAVGAESGSQPVAKPH